MNETTANCLSLPHPSKCEISYSSNWPHKLFATCSMIWSCILFVTISPAESVKGDQKMMTGVSLVGAGGLGLAVTFYLGLVYTTCFYVWLVLYLLVFVLWHARCTWWLFFEYGLYLCKYCQLFLSKVIFRALLEDAVEMVMFQLFNRGSKLGTEIATP